MTKKEIDDVLTEAIARYGFDAQLEMVVEECSELIQAIQKYKRAKGTPQLSSKRADLLEETADVKILIRQIELMFGDFEVNEGVEFKIGRLKERMKTGVL